MPSNRVTRLAEDCTAARHPSAHSVHVDSTWSRSQGRAVKRYGVAVSAPTGQICTVLPLKYDVKGCSSNTLTSMASPRPMKSISASPAISAAKRTQRPHWMQRSRSKSTQLGDGDGLGPVALLLEEAALPRPVGEGLVLQGALSALVAHRAVERMVDEEELEHPVLGLAPPSPRW